MRSVLFVINLVVVIAYSQLLLAQNSAATSSDAKELDTQQREAKERVLKEEKELASPNKEPLTKPSVSTSKNKAPSKVFIPTEEISEDKPVAFPVDI